MEYQVLEESEVWATDLVCLLRKPESLYKLNP